MYTTKSIKNTSLIKNRIRQNTSKSQESNQNQDNPSNLNKSKTSIKKVCFKDNLITNALLNPKTNRKSIHSHNDSKSTEKNKAFDADYLSLAENSQIEKEFQKEEEANFSEEKFKKSRKKMFGILKEYKKFLVGAALSAACNGAVWPIYGILLADAIGILSEKELQLVKTGGTLVAIFFVCLAFAAALVLWMQKYFNFFFNIFFNVCINIFYKKREIYIFFM